METIVKFSANDESLRLTHSSRDIWNRLNEFIINRSPYIINSLTIIIFNNCNYWMKRTESSFSVVWTIHGFAVETSVFLNLTLRFIWPYDDWLIGWSIDWSITHHLELAAAIGKHLIWVSLLTGSDWFDLKARFPPPPPPF